MLPPSLLPPSFSRAKCDRVERKKEFHFTDVLPESIAPMHFPQFVKSKRKHTITTVNICSNFDTEGVDEAISSWHVTSSAPTTHIPNGTAHKKCQSHLTTLEIWTMAKDAWNKQPIICRAQARQGPPSHLLCIFAVHCTVARLSQQN